MFASLLDGTWMSDSLTHHPVACFVTLFAVVFLSSAVAVRGR